MEGESFVFWLIAYPKLKQNKGALYMNVETCIWQVKE